MAEAQYKTIDEYILLQPEDIRPILEEIRKTIRENAPDAVERISWAMPTFWQNENIIHFATAKNHIGIYPGADGVSHFLHKLSDYKTSKGAIQFPLSKPIDYELIGEITRFRVEQAKSRKK